MHNNSMFRKRERRELILNKKVKPKKSRRPSLKELRAPEFNPMGKFKHNWKGTYTIKTG